MLHPNKPSNNKSITGSVESQGQNIVQFSGLDSNEFPIANAIKRLYQEKGMEYIKSRKILNALNDLNAFKDNKPLKTIFRTIVNDNHYANIYSLKYSSHIENDILIIKTRLQNSYGYIPEFIEKVVWEIIIGFEICSIESSVEARWNVERPIMINNQDIQVGQHVRKPNFNEKVYHNGDSQLKESLYLMGVPLGRDISDFDKELTLRGFKRGKNTDIYARYFGDFFTKYSVIHFYFTPLSKKIYRVRIKLKDSLTKKMIKQHFKDIKEIYKTKYGNPTEEDNSNNPFIKYKLPSGDILIQCSPFEVIYEDKLTSKLQHDEHKQLCNAARFKSQQDAMKRLNENKIKFQKSLKDI